MDDVARKQSCRKPLFKLYKLEFSVMWRVAWVALCSCRRASFAHGIFLSISTKQSNDPTFYSSCIECPAAGASTSGFKTVQTQPAVQGCRADVQDLTPGTQYFFQVYAVNSQGASPASSIGQPLNNSTHARHDCSGPCVFIFALGLAICIPLWATCPSMVLDMVNVQPGMRSMTC